MRNPKYEAGFVGRPERMSSIVGGEESVVLSAGIRTITHNRAGLEIVRHKVVVIEMAEGSETVSFDMPPSFARALADRLIEFSDKVEGQNKSFREVKQEIKNGPSV